MIANIYDRNRILTAEATQAGGASRSQVNNKQFQHFGCACALGQVTRYPESRN